MQIKIPLRFHWSPHPEEGSYDPARFIGLCRSAEAMGVESVHVPVAGSLSNALALALAAGAETARVRFRIGWDAAGVLASLFGHEMKTACAALPRRLIFHLSFGTEETALDGCFAQAADFLANCRGLFDESMAPAFDVEGDTADAAFLAIKQADCLWRLPSRGNQVYADALPVLHFGKEVGLLGAVMAGPTRQEALETAANRLPEHAVECMDDPAVWITPQLWRGTVPGWGRKTAALVGSFEEIARAILEFKKNGISQFLVRGSGDWQDMICFGARVMPIIRAIE
jgi:alkanesulfonate monooxygenase